MRRRVAGRQPPHELFIPVLQGGVGAVNNLDALESLMLADTAPGPAFHRTTDVLAARLGVRYLTGAMALILREFIAVR